MNLYIKTSMLILLTMIFLFSCSKTDVDLSEDSFELRAPGGEKGPPDKGDPPPEEEESESVYKLIHHGDVLNSVEFYGTVEHDNGKYTKINGTAAYGNYEVTGFNSICLGFSDTKCVRYGGARLFNKKKFPDSVAVHLWFNETGISTKNNMQLHMFGSILPNEHGNTILPPQGSSVTIKFGSYYVDADGIICEQGMTSFGANAQQFLTITCLNDNQVEGALDTRDTCQYAPLFTL
jgi:hypothetical protein